MMDKEMLRRPGKPRKIPWAQALSRRPVNSDELLHQKARCCYSVPIADIDNSQGKEFQKISIFARVKFSRFTECDERGTIRRDPTLQSVG